MKKFFSRKFIITAASMIIVALSGVLGLPQSAIAALGAITAAYVGGQGYVDGKALANVPPQKPAAPGYN